MGAAAAAIVPQLGQLRLRRRASLPRSPRRRSHRRPTRRRPAQHLRIPRRPHPPSPPAPPPPTSPAVGHIDVPPDVALLNIYEYPAGPIPAAVDIMHKMAVNGNSYYLNETTRFGTEIAASHDLMPDHLTIYPRSSDVLPFTALPFTPPTPSSPPPPHTSPSQAPTAPNLRPPHYA